MSQSVRQRVGIARFGVEYHELSSFTCLRPRRSPACHVTHKCQRWYSCEVAVSPFLFDLAREQSTSHFHTFAVTFVDVSPSRKIWVCVPFLTSMSRP